jgi:hypothetical protein
MTRLENVFRWMLYNYYDRYDIVIGVESDKRDPRGTLGHGKTDTGLWIAHYLETEMNRIAVQLGYGDLEVTFDLTKNMVVRDDLLEFKRIARTPGFGQIKLYDEAEWFFSKKYHAFRDVRALDTLFDSNRKEGGIHILVLPNVYDMIDKITAERLQVLFRKYGRDQMSVHIRNGVVDKNRNLWGWEYVRVRGVRPVPRALWDCYEERYDEHMEFCPEEERCVAAIRDRWGGRPDEGAGADA